MAWFKVDDGFHSSPKLMKIPRRYRLAAIGLWTIAGSWCANQETDGVVPGYMIEEWGGTSALVNQLVTVGLWLRIEDGAEFHSWSDYQPTRAQLEAGRQKNAEKLRKWRGRNQDVTEDVTGLQDGSNQSRNPAPVPSRPDPTRPQLLTESVSLESNGPVDNLTDSFSESIEAASRLAANHGFDLGETAKVVLETCGREITHGQALMVCHHLIGKCRSPVKSPQRYIIGAIRKSPLEVQQFVDTEAA